MKILITGGTGLIGRELVNFLLMCKTKSIKIVSLDKINHKKDEKIMIINRDLNIGNDFTNLTEIKFIRKISTDTIKDDKRTYYLFEGIVK